MQTLAVARKTDARKIKGVMLWESWGNGKGSQQTSSPNSFEFKWLGRHHNASLEDIWHLLPDPQEHIFVSAPLVSHYLTLSYITCCLKILAAGIVLANVWLNEKTLPNNVSQ